MTTILIISGVILSIFATLIGVIIYYRTAYNNTKNKLQDEQHKSQALEKELTNAKTATEIKNHNATISDDAIDEQLHKQEYFRD